MAAFEVIALDTATPQLRAPGASDTYTFPRAVEMPLGTANGVLYLNASKVATSGSALTFDGTVQTIGSANSQNSLFKQVIGSGGANEGLIIVTGATGKGWLGFNNGNNASIPGQVTYDHSTGALGLFANGGPVVFSASGAEGMRLTSTGLGIGTSSPYSKLHVKQGADGTPTQSFTIEAAANDNRIVQYYHATNNEWVISATYGSTGDFKPFTWWTSDTKRMTLDSSGNLGLGVTPSAWGSLWKASQVVRSHFADYNSGAYLSMGHNAYESSGWKYIGTGNATLYQQSSGQHIWLTAASGTAGNPISFSQVMTLDASGNLGVGTTTLNVGTYGKAITLAATASAYGGLELSGTTGGAIDFQTSQSTRQVQLLGNSNGFLMLTNGGSGLTERARITSGGNFVVGTAALATTATDGFLYVPTCAGTPTGTPTTQTGTAPIVVDTTNNKLYFYSGGQWRDAGP